MRKNIRPSPSPWFATNDTIYDRNGRTVAVRPDEKRAAERWSMNAAVMETAPEVIGAIRMMFSDDATARYKGESYLRFVLNSLDGCRCDKGERCPICDPGHFLQTVRCPRCERAGEIDPGDGREEAECPECNGDGRVEP